MKLTPIGDLEQFSVEKPSAAEPPKRMADPGAPDVYLSAGTGCAALDPSSVIRRRTEDKVKKEVAKRQAARTGHPAPQLRKKTKRKNQWESPFLPDRRRRAGAARIMRRHRRLDSQSTRRRRNAARKREPIATPVHSDKRSHLTRSSPMAFPGTRSGARPGLSSQWPDCGRPSKAAVAWSRL